MIQFQIQNSKFKSLFCILVCAVFFTFVFNLNNALATELFFEPQEINTTANQTEKAEIFLRTNDDESVNAFEISVEYPPEFLKLENWSDGNSIINLWIKEPKNDNGIFSFQGIIPGGYSGENGLLMTLYFKGIKEGLAEIKIRNNSKILLNNGLGTPAESSFSLATINIKMSDEKEPLKFEFTEKIPPESFSPIISRSNEIYNGKYFLVFFTQDKNSGIDYYEVSEGNRLFKTARSPYLLENQRLNEDIRIRAIDKAGNIRTEIILVEKTKEENEFKEILFFSVFLLLTIILVIFIKYLYNKIRKPKIKK
ncbi:MAG: hypothetical protein KAQ87_02370 [Candidatus Pacebacteria bacterium]|nr:hypothetical protein [Candidatus Paceibacterota bacterium]